MVNRRAFRGGGHALDHAHAAADSLAQAGATPLQLRNYSVADQNFTSGDALVDGSVIAIPENYPIIGTVYRVKLAASKSAAGLVASVFSVRLGTTGTVADTAICEFHFSAQTAVGDDGTFEFHVLFRTVGATAEIQTWGQCVHDQGLVGLISQYAETMQGNETGIDTTDPLLMLSLSLDVGTSGDWDVGLVEAELIAA